MIYKLVANGFGRRAPQSDLLIKTNKAAIDMQAVAAVSVFRVGPECIGGIASELDFLRGRVKSLVCPAPPPFTSISILFRRAKRLVRFSLS
jgi:hypothetical protein